MNELKWAPCEASVLVRHEAVVDVWKFVRLGILEAVEVSAVQCRRHSLKNWLEAYVLREVAIEVAAPL
jgi:hypothetical protein